MRPPPRTGPLTTHPPPLTTHPPHRQRCHPVAQPCTRSDPILALPPSRYPAAFRAAERSHLPRGPGAAVDPETPRRLARGLLGDSPLSSFWRGLLERYLAPAAPAPRRPAPSEAPGWAAAGGGEGSGPPDVMRMRSSPGVLRGWNTPFTSYSTTPHYSLRTAHYALLTTHYALRTTHYALLTAHYALRTTHCSLGVLRGWLYKTSSSRGPLRRAPSRATHRRFFVLRHRRLQIFASQARCLPPLALAGPPRASHLADCLARRFAPAPCTASRMAPCLAHCMTQGLVSPGTCPPSRRRSLSPLRIPPRRTAPT